VKDPHTVGGAWVVERAVVGRRAVEQARRRLWLEIVRNGLSREDLERFHREKCWWPTLRYADEILALEALLPAALRDGELCEPQILLHFPDEADDWPVDPHLDLPPPWANGRKYLRIVAVPLTCWDELNGTVRFWRGNMVTTVTLAPGDIAVFSGSTHHAGGLNRSGDVRMGVYFRYLEPERLP
jgi:hypothetical protein